MVSTLFDCLTINRLAVDFLIRAVERNSGAILAAMRWLVFALLMVGTGPTVRAQQLCAPADLHASALRAKALQAQLLAATVGFQDMDTNVARPLQIQIHAFKDTLATVAASSLQCLLETADAAALESTLAAALGANLPQAKPDGAADDQSTSPAHVYGADLTVKVSRPSRPAGLLLVVFNFGIACGDDSMLLAYEFRGGRWQQAVRWQADDYDEISGAFGDFFDYQAIPIERPEGAPQWLLAVAHGTPWCTSLMSGFEVNVIDPVRDLHPQKIIYTEKEGYHRGDVPATMRIEPDGFELRMEAYSLDLSLVTRIAFYRYRFMGSPAGGYQVERIQPIANNGRDFVDEWLQSPWGEAAKWAAPDGLAGLEPIHKRIEALRSPETKEWPTFTYGPVRACTDSATHFQVELDQEASEQAKPRPTPPTFFQIREGKNSFTLLSASTQHDPHCAGPDIMAKH